MSGAHLNKKVFVPVPPDRGSFPLDHESLCKEKMLTYMICLTDNKHDNAKCRAEAKEYLNCRMNNQLMAKEDWEYLGFHEGANDTVQN